MGEKFIVKYDYMFVALHKYFGNSFMAIECRSRYFGLFRKGENYIIAKLHRTDLVICSHSREGKSLSYS